MYKLIKHFKNKFHNKQEKFFDTKIKIDYLENRFGSIHINRFCINNVFLGKKFTREYFHYGTINYLENCHEFIAFDTLGLLCGLLIIKNEIELKLNNVCNETSNYFYAKINNEELYFDQLDENFDENFIFLKFCSEFFKTKKFNLFYGNNKHEYIYIFNYMNPFYIDVRKSKEILSSNFNNILQINTFQIKNKRDDIHYKFFI